MRLHADVIKGSVEMFKVFATLVLLAIFALALLDSSVFATTALTSSFAALAIFGISLVGAVGRLLRG